MAEQLIWTTIDGREIPYRDLADDHLSNIIKMLERKWARNYKHACEHAQDGVTICSASDIMPDPCYEWFEPAQLKDLILLAKTRGLKV
jgi:hypothetical protein